MDDNTNNNQNTQVQSSTNQMPVVNSPIMNVATPLPANPFLDNLNLNKYDDLLANFKIKNPDLANKAEKILINEQQNPVLPVTDPIVTPSIPEPISQLIPEIPQMPQVIPQITPVNQIPVEPIRSDIDQPVPKLDPTILTQSFQQFPKGSENLQTSSKASPEYVPASNEAGHEKQVEKIVEELKSIEKSPEETNEKVKEEPKPSNPNENNNQDVPKTNIQQIEKIKVYGYQIPQKILKLGSKVNELARRGDLGSAKTWLYILVGRVIATKNASKNTENFDE